MKFFLPVCIGVLIVSGCIKSERLSFEGGRIHQSTKYHHQIVLKDSVKAEGYVYGIKKLNSNYYIFFSQGRSIVCGEINRFVLSKDISALIVRRSGPHSVIGSSQIGKSEVASLGIAEYLDAQKDMEQRLPMLFDDYKCESDGHQESRAERVSGTEENKT